MLQNAKLVSLHFIVLLALGYGITILFGNPRVSYDGWQYVSSALAFDDGSLAENFFWVRQPGYPILINLSFYFGFSIWPLVIIQTLLFTSSYMFLVWQVRRYFMDLSSRLFLIVTTLSYLFITSFLGGYNLVVLPQSITSAYLMVVVGVLLNYFRIASQNLISLGSIVTPTLTFPILVLIGFSITPILSYLTLFLHLVITCLSFVKHSWIDRHLDASYLFLARKSLVTGFFLSSISLGLSYLAWKNFAQGFIGSPTFNLSQLKDPFWGSGISNYFENLKADPQMLHFIPASFLALLMLIPNTGWNGIVIEKPSSFHSQNADVGFGLFSTNYPDCVSFPEQVLAVNESYVRGLGLKNSCSLTELDLPQLFFFPIMLFWLAICLYWLWQVAIIRKPALLLLSSVPLLFLSSYAVLGGGIDRYGSSVYPIIIVIALLEFVSNRLRSSGKDAHQSFNGQ
jgi:hypothetical protein